MSALLREELKKVTNSVKHLEQSNAELKQEHAKNPDPEYKQAIEENIVVIAKSRARAACLIEEISKIEGIEPHAVEAIDVPAQPQQQQQQLVTSGPTGMDLDGNAGGSSTTSNVAAAAAPAEAQVAPAGGSLQDQESQQAGSEPPGQRPGQPEGEPQGMWL